MPDARSDAPTDDRPILLWFRRDLRLADHPALQAAAATGRAVIPVFLRDEGVEALGAAPRMRIGMSVAALADSLGPLGSRLVLRSGPAASTLRALAAETGAGAIWWTRLFDPVSRATDAVVEGEDWDGIERRAFPGQLLHDPRRLTTQGGKSFRVYAPFFNALRKTDPGEPVPAPDRLTPPATWPASESLADWRLDAAMNRGGPIVAAWQAPGEAGARERAERFAEERLSTYATDREYPSRDGSSRLSENLTHGEASPRALWAMGLFALDAGSPGAERFLKELAWRDFAYHLLWHSPEIATDHWKAGFAAMPWTRGPSVLATAWMRGRTGVRLVDAAMREMYVTGRMHNRARMIVASLLTKHMMVDWRVGQAWFADCLTDWDPASNAVNWQWVAGSGPDASPFFRIFNPETQSAQWDEGGAYARAWIAEGQADPPETALDFFRAIPRSWGMAPTDPYPAPVVDLKEGRETALAAFRSRIRDRGEEPLAGT